jgi:hypothetical protein
MRFNDGSFLRTTISSYVLSAIPRFPPGKGSVLVYRYKWLSHPIVVVEDKKRSFFMDVSVVITQNNSPWIIPITIVIRPFLKVHVRFGQIKMGIKIR